MRKAVGSYHTYSIPGKTATLVPEFAVGDLPSTLDSCACSEGPALGQNTLMMHMFLKINKIFFLICFKTSTEKF